MHIIFFPRLYTTADSRVQLPRRLASVQMPRDLLDLFEELPVEVEEALELLVLDHPRPLLGDRAMVVVPVGFLLGLAALLLECAEPRPHSLEGLLVRSLVLGPSTLVGKLEGKVEGFMGAWESATPGAHASWPR